MGLKILKVSWQESQKLNHCRHEIHYEQGFELSYFWCDFDIFWIESQRLFSYETVLPWNSNNGIRYNSLPNLISNFDLVGFKLIKF